MYLIAGLGNPEKKYEATRHNIGFETIDLLAHKMGISLNKIKHKAVFGDGMISGEKVIIAKPQTYMNLSGESIRDIVNFYKIPVENVIIVCDDINLEIGRIRIRPKGSDGGHNGLKSIIYQLASDGFVRIRMGVGAPKGEHYNLADYVLGKFSKEEIEILTPTANRVVDAVELIIRKDTAAAMNKFNGAAI
ncbi:MAG: aminoacyl-tRNA hydrolase [Clostridia bacterium]|nr:aminoacyl-tRNA hydrolase [Clostridia bacterium]